MRHIIFAFVSLIFVFNTQTSATIINTKHNLSISNIIVPDANETIIKAQTEGEICVFCHIPHQSRPEGKPLWNRSMPASAYTMYDSDYLRRMNYPAVENDLGTANDTPGALSRQCLSCHDGTVAVGAVYKLRRDWVDGTPIAMDGVDASGFIPAESSTSFGTDLSNHHPVGIVYDSTPTTVFTDETRGMELNLATTVESENKVKLFEYNGLKYVECSSCHDPHKDNDKFLHVDGGSHAVNIVNTCTSCHTKTGWTGSVHQSVTNTYSDPEILANYGTNVIDEIGCANCHTPHNANGTPYINRQVQAQTCYQGAASSVDGANCHGVGGAKDIESVVSKIYSHPVGESITDQKHTNLDVLYGYDSVTDTEMTDDRGVGGMSWATNQHAVCMDCHNPHQAKPGTHVADGSWYAAPGTSTNAVSNVLTGVTGVQPVWNASNWTQTKDYNVLNSADYEYQICMKCHSYWGVGPSTDGTTSYISKSGALLTDVSMEININNRSGHPVVVNQLARVGSYAPKELQPEQLLSPWTENPGLNTMYCSDCHGSDAESGGTTNDPKGPHGSTLKYLLKGENQHWPFNANGNLYTMDDIGIAGIDPGDDGLFCKNCHDIAYPHDQWWNKMANKGFKCIECHVAVPHGSPVSRLLGYDTFPAPYNYTDATEPNGWLKMSGYRKNDIVNQKDVWAPNNNSCNGSNCHLNSDAATGAYDDVPVSMQ